MSDRPGVDAFGHRDDLARPGDMLVAPAVIVLALLAWEGAARAELISSLFFPPPSVIVSALGRAVGTGVLWRHTAATLTRVMVGATLAAAIATPLGLWIGGSARARAALDPLVALLHPLPKLAMLPLIMMLVGIGELSRIVVIAAAAFFPMLINSMAGVRQIPQELFDVAHAYGATPRQVFVHVALRGALPFVLTGLRLSLNIGLLLAIAIELVTAQQGLGKMIWLAWQTMRTEELYVALATLALIGVLLNVAVNRFARRVAPWSREYEA